MELDVCVGFFKWRIQVIWPSSVFFLSLKMEFNQLWWKQEKGERLKIQGGGENPEFLKGEWKKCITEPNIKMTVTTAMLMEMHMCLHSIKP